jgi:hypothetical protein
LLRHFDYTVFGDMDDEVMVCRGRTSPPYYVDLCAVSSEGIVVVEIDGYKGHKTRRAILKDKSRLDFIRQKLNARVFRLAFWQLKGMDDDTIAEELGLAKLAKLN